MALVFNGSANTIAGLANGGLPDGCILDADINGMAASKLSGALPAISGASLTNLPGGGKVLQVVSTTKTDTFSGTLVHNGTDRTGDITGLTVSITPSNANNKILLMPSVSCSAQTGYPQILFYKDGSILTDAIGDAANKSYDNSALERMAFSGHNNTYGASVLTGNFLDTAGGTSAITYSMRLTNAKHNGSYGADITMYVNRASDPDEYHASYIKVARFISTFTAMEIAA